MDKNFNDNDIESKNDKYKYAAFWIKNDVIINCDCHEKYMKKFPEMLGIDVDYINNIHKKHNEPFEEENLADEEIRLKLYKDNWIAIRVFGFEYIGVSKCMSVVCEKRYINKNDIKNFTEKLIDKNIILYNDWISATYLNFDKNINTDIIYKDRIKKYLYE